jgi:hypothetical protein
LTILCAAAGFFVQRDASESTSNQNSKAPELSRGRDMRNTRDSRGPSVRAFTGSIVLRTAALLLSAALAACSGGGGGGGGGGGSTAPLVYTGNTSAANISGTNAALLVANVVGGSDASGAFLSAASGSDSGARPFALRLNRALRGTPGLSGSNGRQLTSVPVNETDPCDSGTVSLSGDINQNTGTGTLNVTWNNCRTGNDTLNGAGSVRVDAFDFGFRAVTDGTFTFQRVTLTTPSITGTVSGSLRLQVNFANSSETTTANLITLDGSGKMTMTQNFVVIDTFNTLFAPPSSFTERVSGRLFDSTHGFIDITTDQALVFPTITQRFPSSGRLILTGANNRHVRVITFSSNAVTLGLDLNGDGSSEVSASLKWTDLGAPIAANLADTDGDGMHDSWELANGLNPANRADAFEDADNDGASNLAEYRAGSDPRNAGSTPTLLPPPPSTSFAFTPPFPPPPNPPGPPASPAPEVGPAPTPISARVVDVAGANDIVYDPVTQRIYASVQGTPGSIVPIDPVSGTKDAAIPVGNSPNKLARADNGQFLYVGLDAQSAFQRITLATGTVATFPLGNSEICGPLFVADMQVLPGNPNAVAISHRRGGCSPVHGGVAVYDNGVRRVLMTQEHTGSNVIEFSASASTLYGYNTESTEFGFRRLTVDATGVFETNVFTSFNGDLINGFGVDLRFGGGRIYTTNGLVVDPNIPADIATLGTPGFGQLVAPDAALNRVFNLIQNVQAFTWSLRAFDMASVPPLRLGREDIANISGTPKSLIRWGAKGLAILTTSDQLLLVESTNLIP